MPISRSISAGKGSAARKRRLSKKPSTHSREISEPDRLIARVRRLRAVFGTSEVAPPFDHSGFQPEQVENAAQGLIDHLGDGLGFGIKGGHRPGACTAPISEKP